MPVVKPTPGSPPLFSPKGNHQLSKYFDLTRFISLLHKQSLFFCRLDKLEDQFEGTTSRTNFQYRVKFQQSLRDNGFFEVPVPDEIIIQNVLDNYEFEKKRKHLTCVNCWNSKSGESAALWKIYADFSKGIMIRSSVDQLKKSLAGVDEDIFISMVGYLDYDTDIMPDGNSMYPVIHKQKAYSYEDEIRLIYSITPESGWDFNWTTQEVNEGLYIKADLNSLIEEIVLSPFSPQWYFELIGDLLIKYNLDKPVRKSKLTFLDQ